MTFSRILVVLFASLWCSLASSESIPVSSGEHGDFSRLVFEGSGIRGWVYDQAENDYTIRFPNHRDGFKTQTVYKYIKNDRVKSFTTQNSNFRFQVGCECVVDVFEIGKTVLVVDIKEIKDNPTKSNTEFMEIPTLPQSSQPLQFGARLSNPRLEEFTPASNVSRILQEVDPIQLTSQSKPSVARLPISGQALNDQPSAAQRENLQVIQEQLIQEIGSASSRGLLSPDLVFRQPSINRKNPQVDVSIFNSSHIQQNETETQNRQIRITSSADNLFPENPMDGIMSSGQKCINLDRVDINAWSDNRPFEQQLGDRRSAIFGEFDQIDESNSIALVRLYIHFGFGAEAKNTLNLIEGGFKKWPELFEIAQILEYGSAEDGRVLQKYSECDSVAALWAVMSSRTLSEGKIVNTQAVLRALDSLPAHLRKLLSPDLSMRLLKYGDRPSAQTAMRNLDRLGIQLDGRALLASAEIEISKGESDVAEKMLTDVVNSNSEFSARALIGLIKSEMDTGRTIDIATASLVEAYATELNGSPIGDELKRIHILALAKSGQFDKAFDAVKKLSALQNVQALKSNLFEILSTEAKDANFLKIVFAQIPSLVEMEDKDNVFEVAKRLQKLGFSETSERILIDANVGVNTPEQKKLRAEIALNLGRPAAASAFLIDLEGHDVIKLMAQAKEKKSEWTSAYNLYSQVDDFEAAQNNAWLAEEWQSLTDPSISDFGQLLPVSNRTLDQSEGTAGMMARSQGLLAESLQSRELIDSILQNNLE